MHVVIVLCLATMNLRVGGLFKDIHLALLDLSPHTLQFIFIVSNALHLHKIIQVTCQVVVANPANPGFFHI